MKKTIIILGLILVSLFAPNKVLAHKTADNSGLMVNNIINDKNVSRLLKKKLAIRKVLTSYNSSLIESTDMFISTCINYNLDCYLLPSIAGLESSFGTYTHPNSNNPFGWGGGYIIFASWDEAIRTVGRNLRLNYIDNGANTIEKIAPIYAESDTWATRVSYFRNLFEKEEKKINSVLELNQVNL